MMNKAFLNHEANPNMSTTLFMANYLLREYNDISIEQHCSNEVTSLSKLVDELKAQRQRDVHKLEYYEKTIEAMKRQGYGQFNSSYREPMVKIPSNVLFIDCERTTQLMNSTSSSSNERLGITVPPVHVLKEEVVTPSTEMSSPQFDTISPIDGLKEDLQLADASESDSHEHPRITTDDCTERLEDPNVVDRKKDERFPIKAQLQLNCNESSTSDSSSSSTSSEHETLPPLTDAPRSTVVELPVNASVSPVENVQNLCEDSNQQMIEHPEAYDREGEPKQLELVLKGDLKCEMPADAEKLDLDGDDVPEHEHECSAQNQSREQTTCDRPSECSAPIHEEAPKMLPPPISSEAAEKVDSSYSTIHYANITELVKDFTGADETEDEAETLVIDEAAKSTLDTEINAAIDNLINFGSNVDMDELFDGPEESLEPSGSGFVQQNPSVMDSIEIQLMNLVSSPIKPSEATINVVEVQNEVESKFEFLPDEEESGQFNAEAPKKLLASGEARGQSLEEEKLIKGTFATEESNVDASMLDQTLKKVSPPSATFDVAEMEMNFEPDYEEDD